MPITEIEANKGNAAGQGVERFASVLRVLASKSRKGARLTDVASATGLSKSTVHRLLASLVLERLVDVDLSTNLYFLSFETFALGISAGNRFGLVEIARDCLDWLEELTGDTIFLSARSGNDAVCIDRATGSFPIKVLTLTIGDRRPLGVGAGSLALLAGLEDDAVEAVIAANEKQLRLYAHFTPTEMRNLVAATRSNGFSFNDGGIIPGMQAIGVAIPERMGESRIALSIAATSERMTDGRREELLAHLRTAASQIGDRLAQIATARFSN